TQHPTPYTLNPSPDFLHPTPYTLHQSFSTLHRTETRSVEANGELPWKNNYFLGNDSTKWAPNCRNFSTVVYRDVWDGIDVEWYENDGKLEFDFIVHPGFDPSQIRMSVEGLEGNRISGFGDQESLLSLRERPAPKQSHLDNGNREPETGNSRGEPRTPAVTGVGRTILSDKYSSRGRPSGSLDENVRDLLRDSRTTGGTGLSLRGMERRIVSREADSRSEMTKQSHLGNGEQAIGNGNNVRALLHDTRTTGGISSRTPSPESRTPTNGTPIAQSPLPITELRLPTSLGELRTALPSVYQISANGTRNEIDAAFHLTDENTFGIVLPNGYNPNHSLRIDPLIYSTFLGGSDLDIAYGVTVTDDNEAIVVGVTSSQNYPTTPGVGQGMYAGQFDGFVTKMNSTGSMLLFSTYIGGSGDDHCSGVATGDVSDVTVTGRTSSSNFPTTANAIDRSYNGGQYDCFVAHLNSSGSQLIGSTYLGGSLYDWGTGIVHQLNGDCTIAGYTSSTNFPITTGAFDTSFNGGGAMYGSDCFVARINASCSQLVYCTYLGGSDDDRALSITTDDSENAIFTGTTSSSNFPVTWNAFDTLYNGGNVNGGDCFVAKLNTDGSRLEYCTFIGGSTIDVGTGIVFNLDSTVSIAGVTGSVDFPTTSLAYDTSYNGGVYDGFVTKFDSEHSLLSFSTFLGGTNNDYLWSVCTDSSGNTIATGATSSTDIPTTLGAISRQFNGGTNDCFLSALDHEGSHLNYCTYLGGSGNDGINASRMDNFDRVVIAGTSGSNDYPTTESAFDTSYNGGSGDCFLSHIQLLVESVRQTYNFSPLIYSLLEAYPNPFNSSTTISYSLPKSGTVELKLYDLTGREVATLVNQKQQTGSYRVTFDGKNLSSGTYFVRMQAGEFVKTQKMVLLK
ncbi:MAG: T9SS type A sorting domain-containing protein, partial [bacterium]|nr:T9SS type A sorting domain-containing protein [bacterium]